MGCNDPSPGWSFRPCGRALEHRQRMRSRGGLLPDDGISIVIDGSISLQCIELPNNAVRTQWAREDAQASCCIKLSPARPTSCLALITKTSEGTHTSRLAPSLVESILNDLSTVMWRSGDGEEEERKGRSLCLVARSQATSEELGLIASRPNWFLGFRGCAHGSFSRLRSTGQAQPTRFSRTLLAFLSAWRLVQIF